MADVEYDPTTGEEIPQIDSPEEDDEGRAGRGDGGERLSLADIAEETRKRIEGAPLSDEEIRGRIKSARAIAVGIMGWFPKIGQIAKKDGDAPRPGSSVEGQIVATRAVAGRFGRQQIVIIQGRASWPTYRAPNGEAVKAVKDRPGRWIVGVDASLQELPSYVGEVVRIEVEKRGGSGQRHVYKAIDLYSASQKAG